MFSKIESVQNEKIKAAVKLSQSAKTRAEEGLFFLEGLRLCADTLNSSLVVDSLFYTPDCFEKHSETIRRLCDTATNVCEISASVSKKLSQTQAPQGVYCLVRTKEILTPDRMSPDGKYVALEVIQDPANLGAIIRTAEALGVDGALLCGCCDIYNPKALRASMGSLLRLPLFESKKLPETLMELRQNGTRIFATTPDAKAAKITETPMRGGVLLVIGNEGNGVSPQTLRVCTPITIPMLGRAESLNASMAAAIAMWEMMKQNF